MVESDHRGGRFAIHQWGFTNDGWVVGHHICWHKAGYSFDVNLIVAALLVKAAFLFVFNCDKLQKDRQVVPGCCLWCPPHNFQVSNCSIFWELLYYIASMDFAKNSIFWCPQPVLKAVREIWPATGNWSHGQKASVSIPGRVLVKGGVP